MVIPAADVLLLFPRRLVVGIKSKKLLGLTLVVFGMSYLYYKLSITHNLQVNAKKNEWTLLDRESVERYGLE